MSTFQAQMIIAVLFLITASLNRHDPRLYVMWALVAGLWAIGAFVILLLS